MIRLGQMPKYPFNAVLQLLSLVGIVEHSSNWQIVHLLLSLTGGYTLRVTCLQALVKTEQQHPSNLGMIKIFSTPILLHLTSQTLILGACLDQIEAQDVNTGTSGNSNNSISHLL